MKKWMATALGACCLLSTLSFVGCGGGGGGSGEAGKLPVDEYYKGEYTETTKVDMATLQAFAAQVDAVQSYDGAFFATMSNNVGLKANVSLKEETKSAQYTRNSTTTGTQWAIRQDTNSDYQTEEDYVVKSMGAKITQKSYFDGEYDYYLLDGVSSYKLKFASTGVDSFSTEIFFYTLPYVLEEKDKIGGSGNDIKDVSDALGTPATQGRNYARAFTVTDAWIDYADETDNKTKVKINYSLNEDTWDYETQTWKLTSTNKGSYIYVYENDLLVGFRAEGTHVDILEGVGEAEVVVTTAYTIEVLAWEGELKGLTDEEKKDYLLDGYQGE